MSLSKLNYEENIMAKSKKKVMLSPPRNPLFNHPLMKKSCIHQKNNKTKRKADKAQLRKEWYHPIAA